MSIPFFSCADRVFTVGEIVQAACFRGELEQPCNRLTRALECERKAVEELELELDETALQKMSEEFRYEHDLITAEGTERWLEQRGLTLDDFSDHFARRYWAGTLNDKVAPKTIKYVSADAELRDLLKVDMLLSGEFDAMALRLCWRVAAKEAASDEPDPESIATERRCFLEREKIEEAALPGWLDKLGCDQRWFDEISKLEAIYRRECDALLTTETCERAISMLRMQLTQFDVETVEVDSRDAAGEVLLCVREDGMSLSEVAAEGRYAYRHAKVVLDDLPPETQQRFLCAAPGEVLEPMPHGDGFQLCRVVEKIEPSLADAMVRNRVERQLLERHFSELVAKHIHWLIAPKAVYERANR